MKILFAGTPNFSLPSLEYVKKNYNLIGIITQPDKPQGRGLKIKFSPVKEFGIKNNIPVFQPYKLNDGVFINTIKNLSPDFILEVAYGKIFPEEVINIPKECSINIHPSLLPGYRGASPIRWAIINNENITGVSANIMTKEIDTGKIIYQEKIDILPEDTYGSLYEKLSIKSAGIISKVFAHYFEKNFLENISDVYKVKNFYARKMEHSDFKINWNKSALEIYNLIRASYPKPGTYTFYNSMLIKIYEAEIVPENRNSFEPGEIVISNIKKGIIVKTGNGMLKILKLQKENKKVLYYKDFLNGIKIKEKEKFS